MLIPQPSAPQNGGIMKSLLLTGILGVALLAPALARADASEQGCKSSDDKAKGCTKDPTAMPEPGVAILAGSGLLALGGLVLLRRKQESN
jgi:LPXTG-motif cell wall-anchored protein